MASSTDEEVGQSAEVGSRVDHERREALRRIARFGAYTAPTLLAMLTSEKAASVS
jgi:hypothetical protein